MSTLTWVREFMDEVLLAPGGRPFRTLILLIAKPGELTRQYLAGRRVSQMPPIRTYLVLSALIFLLAPPIGLGSPDEHDFFIENQPVGELSDERPDSHIRIPNPREFPSSWFPELANQSIKRIQSIDNRYVLHRVFSRRLAAVLPTALLTLIPMMALLLAAFFFRSKRPLFDHLLFAVQFQSSILTAVLVLNSLDRLMKLFLDGAPPFYFITGIGVFVTLALPLSLKRVYEKSWPITLAHSLVFALLFAGFSKYILPAAYMISLLTL